MVEVLVRGVPQHPVTLQIDNGRPVDMEGTRIIGLGFLMVIGIYTFIYACLDYFKKRTWSMADGRIIRIVFKWNTPFPIVSFFPSNHDAQIEFEGAWQMHMTPWHKCKVDDVIRVRYDPSNPNNAEIGSLLGHSVKVLL